MDEELKKICVNINRIVKNEVNKELEKISNYELKFFDIFYEIENIINNDTNFLNELNQSDNFTINRIETEGHLRCAKELNDLMIGYLNELKSIKE